VWPSEKPRTDSGAGMSGRFDLATSVTRGHAWQHTSNVWTTRTLAACAATALLAGCGGGSHAAGASSSGNTASSRSTPTSPATKTLPKSYRPLLAAVTDYFTLVRGGDIHRAYQQAVSDRCRREETFAEFRRVVGTGQLAPGVQIWAYRSHGKDHGAVQFIYPKTPFTPTAWPWIKERGVWKEDGCAPSN
jgi:hypothetical protein